MLSCGKIKLKFAHILKNLSRINFIVVFLVFLAHTSFSQVLNNNLVILSENGNRFTLSVNGEKINNEPQANVKAFNISEGWCKLKVEFEKDNVVFSDSIRIKPIEKYNNKEITYSIIQNSKTSKFSFVSIGELSAPKIPKVAEAPVDLGPVIDNNLYGNLYKSNDNKPSFFKNYNDSSRTCIVELTNAEINYAIDLVKKSNDLQNKYKYVEIIINQNCYTASQLTALLNLLALEMDKLKLVKLGYAHVKDKNNMAGISEIFKFKSMKEDYVQFLKDVANSEHQQKLNCSVAVTNETFSEILSAVKKTQYENDKVKVAKDKLVFNCVNTQQIQLLMDVFNHDREKMELAKAAYPVTVDKDNFKILVENFQFSENKNDFLKLFSK